MTLSDSDLAVIRSWTGSQVGVDGAAQYGYDDVIARFERHGDPLEVAVEILRQRRADFLADPLSLNLDGDYTQNAADNVRFLDRRIGDLERAIAQAEVEGTGGISVGLMGRVDTGR